MPPAADTQDHVRCTLILEFKLVISSPGTVASKSHVSCRILSQSKAPQTSLIISYLAWHHLRQAVESWEDSALAWKFQCSVELD
jgi:hypothetical protein